MLSSPFRQSQAGLRVTSHQSQDDELLAPKARRAALWGALGGAALPLLTTMNDSVLVNTIPLGAIFAASTVAIVRRAALREAEQVEHLPPDSAPPRLPA